MASQLSLYKAAALILKEPATTLTVSDDSVLVNTLNTVFTDCRNFVLEQGKWNFAARTVSLDASEDVEPEFGFSAAFEKPSDYRNLIKLSWSSTLYPPFRPGEYVDEGGYWYANVDPLFASIVSDGAGYGGDLSLWPGVVARALEYELAFRAAPHATTMGETGLGELEKRKKRALREAKSWDAAKQPPEPNPPGRLVTARQGRLGWRREGWQPR